jgi:hypothetical protein
METLKKYGLHHALPVFALAWLAVILGRPDIGIAISIYGAGRYEGREEKEAELRGFRPFTPSTWKLDQFEWRDFLPVWAVATFNIWIMMGMS